MIYKFKIKIVQKVLFIGFDTKKFSGQYDKIRKMGVYDN